MTLILVGLATWAMVTSPKLKDPIFWIPFILLTLIHLALHWSVVSFQIKPSLYIFYLAGQGALVFAICGLSGTVFISYGLYLALIGEAVGIFRSSVKATASILFYLVLSFINYRVFAPEMDLWSWLLPFIPITLFVWIYVRSFVREVEARGRAQKLSRDLELANQQLSDYAARVEQLTLLAERQRIARELHDSLSAGLAGTILQLEAADSHLSAGNPQRAQVIINHAMERARGALADAREMIDQLRSGKQPEMDLEEMLRSEARRLRDTLGIACEVEIDPGLEIGEEIEEAIYRMVGEGLSNIERHAAARHCWVRLKSAGGRILLEIEDDGVGFDPDERVGVQGHYGLLGLKERARQIGATVEIHSQAGQGCLLRVSIPRVVEKKNNEESLHG